MASWKHIRESEPVRVWMYPLLLVGLGIAVQQHVITTDVQGAVETIIAAIFGIGAVEGARGRVTPVRPAQHILVNPEPGYDIPRQTVDEYHGRHEQPEEWQSGGAHAWTEEIPQQRPNGY